MEKEVEISQVRKFGHMGKGRRYLVVEYKGILAKKIPRNEACGSL